VLLGGSATITEGPIQGNRAYTLQIIIALLIGSVFLDAFARPRPARIRPFRSWNGTWMLFLLVGVAFGGFLILSGNTLASLILTLAVVGLFTMVSNVKQAVLGEPLVFTDMALIGAVFRHPQFYFSALTIVEQAGLALMVPLVGGLLWWFFLPGLECRLASAVLVAVLLVLIRLTVSVQSTAIQKSDLDLQADVLRDGLLPTLLFFWLRWRGLADPQPVEPIRSDPADGELAILVQCESFADPIELFANPKLGLPGLAAAREQAWQWGNLLVHGFGAYTMRTEYGVLFGRCEDDLGYRRFDPFLTALNESSFALPARLSAGGWNSLFVHPHDMRFYNRDKIMRASGFNVLVGQDEFSACASQDGRYVSDARIAEKIVNLAKAAMEPTLIYAVTIENHGPWASERGVSNLRDGYLELVRRGDEMLATLIEELAELRRPATLVFFGDHRPSIPGHTDPTGPRHTPYVILRLNAEGKLLRGTGTPIDLTPAALHHWLIDLWTAGAAS
jgi:hypothetical protein